MVARGQRWREGYDNKVTAQGSCHVIVPNYIYVKIHRTVHQKENQFYCMVIKKKLSHTTVHFTHTHTQRLNTMLNGTKGRKNWPEVLHQTLAFDGEFTTASVVLIKASLKH